MKMGAENSVMRPPTKREPERRSIMHRSGPPSQYYDAKNTVSFYEFKQESIGRDSEIC